MSAMASTAADPSVVDPVEVKAGSGSDVDGEADNQEKVSGVSAPQGYQHGSGAGGWSTAQVQQLVESTVMSILHGMGKGNGKGLGMSNESEEENMVLLEERFFQNMEKFEDSLEGWSGWVFNLNIEGVSRKVAQLFERVLADKDKTVTKDKVEALVGKEEVDRYGGEVFRLLCSLTKGEANTVVRSAAIGQDGRHNGFLALKMLSNRFNPKTPAKLFRALMEALVPGMVKEAVDVPRVVEE